jgi:PAS domain S-box-containing protein
MNGRNEYQQNLADTPERSHSEHYLESVRQQGGMFVEAVRVTRMPMIMTDATLPGNPITFANHAFIKLSGYSLDELQGQHPHFMNGEETDPRSIAQYEAAMNEGRDETLEILQYRKDGTPFRAMLFATPINDGQGTVTNHFLSYLDVTRRFEAEKDLLALTAELESRVASRTAELEALNEKLKLLVAEREMLLVEVNHRAKNSLAVAASLLGIQARRLPDKAVKILFEEAQDRLFAMARVHDLLSKSESSQRVDIATYVGDLCEALRPITESDERVTLKLNADERILVDADTAFSLGIILTELITNAVKYAFPPPRSGTILVQARRSQPGFVELIIEDDGIGMSHLREGSLGYGLLRSLVLKIRGEIEIRSEAGLRVRIVFPDTSPLES